MLAERLLYILDRVLCVYTSVVVGMSSTGGGGGVSMFPQKRQSSWDEVLLPILPIALVCIVFAAYVFFRSRRSSSAYASVHDDNEIEMTTQHRLDKMEKGVNEILGIMKTQAVDAARNLGKAPTGKGKGRKHGRGRGCWDPRDSECDDDDNDGDYKDRNNRNGGGDSDRYSGSGPAEDIAGDVSPPTVSDRRGGQRANNRRHPRRTRRGDDDYQTTSTLERTAVAELSREIKARSGSSRHGNGSQYATTSDRGSVRSKGSRGSKRSSSRHRQHSRRGRHHRRHRRDSSSDSRSGSNTGSESEVSESLSDSSSSSGAASANEFNRKHREKRGRHRDREHNNERKDKQQQQQCKQHVTSSGRPINPAFRNSRDQRRSNLMKLKDSGIGDLELASTLPPPPSNSSRPSASRVDPRPPLSPAASLPDSGEEEIESEVEKTKGFEHDSTEQSPRALLEPRPSETEEEDGV